MNRINRTRTMRFLRHRILPRLGDIAKDHPELAFATCERWLAHASNEVKWLIRHALRHPASKRDKTALRLRAAAK